MLLLILHLALLQSLDTTQTPTKWDNTKNWKIYALNNSDKVFTISTDSIQTLNSVLLGDDSMHILLKNAQISHFPVSPAWMGCYLTSCENEKGRIMKIVVSQYGGFLLNSNDGNYYQLDAKTTRAWLGFMRRAYIKTE